MTQKDWGDGHVVGVFLNGGEIADVTPKGRPIEDDSFLVLFNGHYEDVTFTLPARRFGAVWTHEFDTAVPSLEPDGDRLQPRDEVHVVARSMHLLRRVS